MTHTNVCFKGISLFTDKGERKYLSSTERQRFYDNLAAITDPIERSYVETIYWTGCRPSEALSLTPINIDLDGSLIAIQSLKKRGRMKGKHYRAIPVPRAFVERLNKLHHIQHKQDLGPFHEPLWGFSRTKGWRLIKIAMNAANIIGARATGRGLRHSYGVHAALSHVPETRIKKWLGHESLATTEIYLDVGGSEDRAIARRMWGR